MLLLGSRRRWNRKGKRNAFLVYLTSITRHLWSIWGVNLHVFHKFFFCFFRMCLISLKGIGTKDFVLFFFLFLTSYCFPNWVQTRRQYLLILWGRKDKTVFKTITDGSTASSFVCFNCYNKYLSCQVREKKFFRAESQAIVTVFAIAIQERNIEDQKCIVRSSETRKFRNYFIDIEQKEIWSKSRYFD